MSSSEAIASSPSSLPPDAPLTPPEAQWSGRSAWRMLPGMLRRMLPMLALDGALPLLLYLLLRPNFAATSVTPLAVAVLFPLLGSALNLARRRRLDTMGLLVVLSLVASLGVVLLGGDQRLLLITRMLMMPVMGLACLVSLALPKPLAFYMARQFLTGDEQQPGATFDALWRYPSVRSASRWMTLVWGVAMVSEFVLRVLLIVTLPVALALGLSSAVMMAVGIGLGVWNIAYGIRAFHHIRALTRQTESPVFAGSDAL